MTAAFAPNSVHARDIAFLVHHQTDIAGYRETGGTLMARGEGVYVYDEAGKKYLEAMAGLWCASLGFSERRLAEVAYRQMLELPYYHHFFAKGNIPSVDLAERLVQLAPVPMSKVLFSCSGSEANDAAIKLVWYYHNAIGKPQKKKIIGRVRGYHGNTVAAVSLSGQPQMHSDFDVPLPQFRHTDNPHYYRFHEDGETEEQFATRMANNLEQLILREGPDTVAAFFGEPVQGAGGAITPPATYWEKIQAVLRKYDILLIADEVICGFGRTGNVWGCQTYGIEPDMLSCAKALSASYQPISALLVNEKIYQAMLGESKKIGSFAHGFTYAAHPVACAVAVETLKIYEERDIFTHVRRVSPVMQEGLKATEDHPMVGNARGVGLIAGVELMADKRTRTPFPAEAKAGALVERKCLEAGLVVRAIGDRIAFTPPLIMTEENLQEMCALFRKGLDAAWAELKG
ncbi:Putrescine--pyruvate aminotransferase [Rhodovastum atsumiense]|uniref:Aspartate aminotransferase family protein n=1 Tax=Rhodovastum atsumiense TaxID=504468 RepID=A0A5M6IJL9_9PROT|nr:aspartate aminotransferase family protein [Rhodovastum atsumiense]KAA5608029.1 aspartate aminotransferase family protein [Rhodovastum atsumiense]CAH2604983.1 Putrescine--pyruvate aminotransferase [Rhodovastum atsumiense]